ncbi:MAG: response regulator [bacterium]|nr:response regulator [bacterium]
MTKTVTIEEEGVRRPPARLLVVDDSVTIRMSLRDLFVEQGYTVLVAEDGKSGIELLRSEDVDVVVLDLVMPGMSGVEVLREMKADDELRLISVLMLTATSDRDELVACLDLGADDYIVKPWEARELLARLRVMVRLKHALDAAVTARRAAEEAARAKSDFLANMSHEIRTPMTAILGFAEVLLERGDLEHVPAQWTQAAETIKRNGEFLLRIINDVLDLSKIEAGRMEVERIACSPHQLVAEVAALVQVCADAKGLRFDLEHIGPMPETIQTDPTRLRQILINLIGNAIKFTEVGGVRLISRLADDHGEPCMCFDVADTGLGMNPDQVARLFQPFTQADASATRRFGGTGLGLTISRRFATLLGGEISLVDTAEGVGTCFRVSVPTGPLDGVRMLSERRSTTGRTKDAPPVAAGADQAAIQGSRVLLAEDGPDNQRLIAHVLEQAGADVEVVENGRLAVDAVRAAGDRGAPYNAVVMDMQMPVMDGYEATALLRQDGYTTPIIALTAHAMQGDRERCLHIGCDEYASKPIDRRMLVDLIQRQVQAPTSCHL